MLDRPIPPGLSDVGFLWAGHKNGGVTDVVISQRFNGPPGSGHGGYTSGLLAAALGSGSAVVTLRRPPQVERPLELSVVDGVATLRDGDVVIAEASEADHEALVIDLPDPVSFEDTAKAAAEFDVEDYIRRHPFPTCFVCGPDRAPGDGLRIFPVSAAPGVVTCPWVPDESLAGPDGRVDPVYLWAAMDCPSGLSRFDAGIEETASVLGRMAGVVQRSPDVGEQLVVAGWSVGLEGRKRTAGSVVWGADGEVLAQSRTTWIVLDDEQFAAFKAG
jgi:hypothetical protein